MLLLVFIIFGLILFILGLILGIEIGTYDIKNNIVVMNLNDIQFLESIGDVTIKNNRKFYKDKQIILNSSVDWRD